MSMPDNAGAVVSIPAEAASAPASPETVPFPKAQYREPVERAIYATVMEHNDCYMALKGSYAVLITRELIVSPERKRVIARPRQIAMYIARQYSGRSLPDIGRRIGDRDHTTVLHACRRIESLMQESPALAYLVDRVARRYQWETQNGKRQTLEPPPDAVATQGTPDPGSGAPLPIAAHAAE